jgi:hypothetical protein
MSDQVNKEQTKDAKQDEITERSDEQLDEAAGGGSLPAGTVVDPGSQLLYIVDTGINAVEGRSVAPNKDEAERH